MATIAELARQHTRLDRADVAHLQRLVGEGLLNSEGATWLRQRRLAQPAFHRSRIDAYGNVMVDYTEPGATKRAEAALDELFRQVLAWDGSITGEHGIGLAKKRWWPLATSPELRNLHRTVKHAIDPHGILNPGKFL